MRVSSSKCIIVKLEVEGAVHCKRLAIHMTQLFFALNVTPGTVNVGVNINQ